MASRIKGITIDIGGDTTKLQSALKGVDGALRTTQANLKDINKLLKMDPSNVNLLKQKQENLSKAINETKERLKVLKDAYKQLDGQETEEAKEQQKALAREISETESKLKSLKAEMSDFGSVGKQVLQNVGNQIKNAGEKLTDVGKDLTAKVTAPLVGLGAIGVNYNAQMEQYRVMFTTLTGSAEDADKIISQLQSDAQKSPFDSSTLIKANQYLISAGVEADQAREDILNLGNAIAATGGGSAELERMSANLQQIKNIGKASSIDIKQFANAGINIYGLLAQATGKTVEQVKDMDVTYEQLSYALAMASQEGGIYYQAMENQSQTMTGSLNALKESITMLLGQITEAAMPIIMQVIQAVQNVVNWFMNLDESQKKMILTIAAVIAAIGPALAILGQVLVVIGALVVAIGGVIGVISLIPSPITIIVALITAMIVIFNKLNITWDTVVAKAKELLHTIANTAVVKAFGEAWEGIIGILGSVAGAFSSVVNWIGNAISKVGEFLGISSGIGGVFSTVGRAMGGGNFGGGTFVSQSGGYGALMSGGYSSGGLVLNANFNVNANNVTRSDVKTWANWMADDINEALGRKIR